ncbi:MAG: aminoacetone oxidase family FAD-binding enzyme [Pseudobutyrivibrio sp.]|nr:aminoacetone oxidase family FAD-binding enzyme [Pseudobutyrivibrio sp.]
MENNNIYDICIVGAGFSGLVLAIKSARAGLLVSLIESNQYVGRRILSTGNGRCNFTNSNMGPEFYYSNSNLDFIKDQHQELIDFMRGLGLISKSLDGYYYPITNQAKTVRTLLENEINNHENIDLYLNCTCKEIDKKDVFIVSASDKKIRARNVAIATGGQAAPTLGTTKLAYKTALKFGMKVTELSPALVGLESDDICLKSLAGLRALGQVSYRGHSCQGEIQFNKDGVSGYPVMCISRFVGFDGLHKNLSELHIDFLPYFTREKARAEIKDRFDKHKESQISTALYGICPEKAIDQVLQEARIYSDTRVSKLDEEDLDYLLDSFKDFKISLKGTKGFNSAQVTAGGVSLEDVDLNTLMSKLQSGLYFMGEALDVDGICGGYNLQWAYSSASLVATSLIEECK